MSWQELKEIVWPAKHFGKAWNWCPMPVVNIMEYWKCHHRCLGHQQQCVPFLLPNLDGILSKYSKGDYLLTDKKNYLKPALILYFPMHGCRAPANVSQFLPMTTNQPASNGPPNSPRFWHIPQSNQQNHLDFAHTSDLRIPQILHIHRLQISKISPGGSTYWLVFRGPVLSHFISLDFGLYSEHIFFLAGYAPLKILWLAWEAGLRSSWQWQ